ncbi:unnamed protein product [Rotaria sordida]|uniref:PLAT domain-containing protein n=1 Tax=Rotaria sordida TaxID=392033 RepID=A0A820D9Q5_9BILA|nr:unnamed protein product [Rotaria sordida]CAF4224364.1 unnamed protein product [Rotaria sordida]
MRQYRILSADYLHDLFQAETYKNVTDLSSLRISEEVVSCCLVLNEELMKFQGKRVFDTSDEPQLISTSKNSTIKLDKRVFDSCDKSFCVYRWLSEEQENFIDLLSEETLEQNQILYRIKIVTSSENDSDTDSHVFMKIYGENDQTK